MDTYSVDIDHNNVLLKEANPTKSGEVSLP